MRVVFLANGAPGSAAVERAERIAAAIDGDTVVVARRASRWRDLLASAGRLRTFRPDVVYAVDLAVVPVVPAVAARPRTPLVVDTGDAPADFLRLVGAPAAARSAAALLERVAYGRSAAVVVRGPRHLEVLRARGVRNVHHVPDGVDLDVVRPVDDEALRVRLGLEGVLTVGISGRFTWYPKLGGGLGQELVRALALVDGTPVHAVLIGDGPGLPHLRLLAQELGVAERLHVIGRVPYAELSRYLGLCDVCLLTQTDDPSSQIRTTGKLPVYLASGRFVVASRVGAAAEVLPEEMLLDYQGAWDEAYPARLATRLEELARDPERREKGLALREVARRFSYDRVAGEAAAVIEAVA